MKKEELYYGLRYIMKQFERQKNAARLLGSEDIDGLVIDDMPGFKLFIGTADKYYCLGYIGEEDVTLERLVVPQYIDEVYSEGGKLTIETLEVMYDGESLGYTSIVIEQGVYITKRIILPYFIDMQFTLSSHLGIDELVIYTLEEDTWDSLFNIEEQITKVKSVSDKEFKVKVGGLGILWNAYIDMLGENVTPDISRLARVATTRREFGYAHKESNARILGVHIYSNKMRFTKTFGHIDMIKSTGAHQDREIRQFIVGAIRQGLLDKTVIVGGELSGVKESPVRIEYIKTAEELDDLQLSIKEVDESYYRFTFLRKLLDGAMYPIYGPEHEVIF